MALAKSLALFDFDNTLSICDSFIPFSLFVGRPVKFLSGLTRLAQRRLKGPVGRREAKQIMAQATLGGLSLDSLYNFAAQFKEIFVPAAMNSNQLTALKNHKDLGDRIIIVSASPRLYLEIIAKSFNVELIATELVVDNGIITGEILGQNCRGSEKVRRILEILNLSDYQSISAYGDSEGDKEMLEIATNPVYRGGRDWLYSIRKFFSLLILYFRCLLGF